jgi:hypothetical protein
VVVVAAVVEVLFWDEELDFEPQPAGQTQRSAAVKIAIDLFMVLFLSFSQRQSAAGTVRYILSQQNCGGKIKCHTKL